MKSTIGITPDAVFFYFMAKDRYGKPTKACYVKGSFCRDALAGKSLPYYYVYGLPCLYSCWVLSDVLFDVDRYNHVVLTSIVTKVDIGMVVSRNQEGQK